MTDCWTWVMPAKPPYWKAAAWTRGGADSLVCFRSTREDAITARDEAMRVLDWRRYPPLVLADRVAEIMEHILAEAPTYAEAKEIAAIVETIPANQRGPLEQLFLDMVVEAEDEDKWRTTVCAMAWGYAQAVREK